MAIARTGVFVDDYLEYSSTLPAELQRILNTMRELDDRSQAMINQTRDQTKYCLGIPSQSYRKISYDHDEAELEKMRKDIEASQENALSLCTEKILLARQAYDLIDSHMKRLDEDLGHFAEDLKQEGKIPPDEPAILPPLPIIPRDEKRKLFYGTPQSKRIDFRDRDWERDRDRDFDLMPPPSSHKKNVSVTIDTDQPIDPNEETYCICHQVSFGDMIACDNENCEGRRVVPLCLRGSHSRNKIQRKVVLSYLQIATPIISRFLIVCALQWREGFEVIRSPLHLFFPKMSIFISLMISFTGFKHLSEILEFLITKLKQSKSEHNV